MKRAAAQPTKSQDAALVNAIVDEEYDTVLKLLLAGANPDLALITAAKNDNVQLSKLALVFEANVQDGFSKVSSIPDDDLENKGEILQLMRLLGAQSDKSKSTKQPSKTAAAADKKPTSSLKDRVLCLDGGGLRGLVEMQTLLAIEKEVGQPIAKCFDWVAGTSAGGIISLIIAHGGATTREIFGYMFDMKELVFTGDRPYESEAYEQFTQDKLGPETKMSDLKAGPRILVFSTLANCIPAELEIFRNYDLPSSIATTNKQEFLETTRYDNTAKAWQVARATGAAPTYFREFSPYIDGAVIANNPTIDALTEIEQFYAANGKKPNIGIVVSLGTGLNKSKAVDSVDMFLPTSFGDAYEMITNIPNFVNMITTQVSQADGRILDRARSWCRWADIGYYRLNPLLEEEIPLDCQDNETLINMLYTTKCYLYDHRQVITEIANQLRR